MMALSDSAEMRERIRFLMGLRRQRRTAMVTIIIVLGVGAILTFAPLPIALPKALLLALLGVYLPASLLLQFLLRRLEDLVADGRMGLQAAEVTYRRILFANNLIALAAFLVVLYLLGGSASLGG